MADDLHDELTEIAGIGDAKAEEIIEVYEEHGTSPLDQILEDVHGDLEEAIDYADEGQPGYAMKFVHRAHGKLTLEEADDE